jgi:hypothetical protein
MASTSPLLNSAREIKIKFSKRLVRAPLLMRLLLEDLNKKERVPDAIATTPLCELPNSANSSSMPSVAEGH